MAGRQAILRLAGSSMPRLWISCPGIALCLLFSRELTVAVADNVKGFGVSPLGPCRVEAWYIEENK